MSSNLTYQVNIIKPLLEGKSYEEIMVHKDSTVNGHMAENLSITLILTKCADNILDTAYELQTGNFEDKRYPLKSLKSCKTLFEGPFQTGGDKCDIPLKDSYGNIHPISVKTGHQGEVPAKTDCTFLKDLLKDEYNQPNTLPILICDDKSKIENTLTGEAKGNKLGKDKKYHTEMIMNDKIKDIEDIKRWISIFHKKYGGLTYDEFIEKIDSEILNNHKQYLQIRLHQEITKRKIMRLINGGRKRFVIAHKPRSGKTYLILYLLNLLIKDGTINRVLVWTSVKDTIQQFTSIIDGHYDFNGLNYEVIEKQKVLPDDFKGIAFTTSQYLKCDKTGLKKEFLEKNHFDCIVVDESHWGSSTTKTISGIIHTIMQDCNEQLVFYLSATPRKTISKYKIPHNCVFKWDIIDEGYMKNITDMNSIQYKTMINKYDKEFEDVFNDISFSKDYSHCPIPILIQPAKKSLEELKKLINDYNNENNTELGISFKSLFALEVEVEGRKKVCKDEFQLAKTPKGTKVLEYFLKMVYDEDSQDVTIYDNIFITQKEHKSRKSTDKNPKGCLLFTSDMGNIDVFQKSFIKFIKERGLWDDCYVDYCNCKKSNKISETYENALIRCKEEGKEILLFLLNQQGGLGITYPKCDSVIMLDDSNNAEQYYQRIMRCMTESKNDEEPKTCGIIVDFNWKRQLMWVNDLCKQVQTEGTTRKSKQEILINLVEHNIFKINPRKHGKFGWDRQDISEYMNFISDEIQNETDEDLIWSGWSCPDTLDIRKLDKCFSFTNEIHAQIPEQLQGQGQDIPDASTDTTTVNIDTDPDPDTDTDTDTDTTNHNDELCEDIFTDDYINNTELLIRDRLAWIFAISMSYETSLESFNDVVQSDFYSDIIKYIIEKSDINDKYENIIESILYIMNQPDTKTRMNELIELYGKTSIRELRSKIDKNMKATEEERLKNAEVHTCFELVDKLLDLVPVDIWKTPHKVADLSCGKGNIVRGIFSKFFYGLEAYQPDPVERCILILQECIYISDIEPINVWTTKLLLCLECRSYSSLPALPEDGIEEKESESLSSFLSIIEQHSNVGDSLTLDINELWNIDGFDAIIENPPYNEKNKNGKTVQGKNKLYSKFMDCDLKRLVNKGYLIYVTPLGWITGTMTIYNEVIKHNMECINFNKVQETYFPNIGDSLCYYSICKEDNKFNTKVIDYNGAELYMAFKGKKESKLFPVVFTKENITLLDKVLMLNSIYNGFINVKEWREGTRDDMITEQSDGFCYEIKEFKTTAKSKYTNINNESRYGKKFIIYEICGSIDCEYYARDVYAGSHTFYLDIEDDKYGFLLEKWFQTKLFSNIYDITKSSQYLKNGLVKHIKLPPKELVDEIDINNIEEYQNKFYGIE
jgi:hypothetical protein